jgi:hypothetical protein
MGTALAKSHCEEELRVKGDMEGVTVWERLAAELAVPAAR